MSVLFFNQYYNVSRVHMFVTIWYIYGWRLDWEFVFNKSTIVSYFIFVLQIKCKIEIK